MSLYSVLSSLGWLVVLVVIGINTLPSEASKTHCASKLYDALDLICTYGSQPRLKKSIEPVDNFLDAESLNVLPVEGFPLYSRYQQSALEKSRRRRHHEIVNECCEKQCSMNQLLMFCNNY